MDQVNVGRSGLRTSRLILGTASFGDTDRAAWNVAADDIAPLVRHAFDHGITAFDTGSTYGGGLAESRLGAALAQLGRRDEVVLTTKVYFPTGPGANDRGLSRKHVIAALDRSLARLQTDHVDMLMIHRWDPATPVEETLTTLDQLVRSGRVRYIGASSMSAWRLMKALALQRAGNLAPFVAMQGLYNLLYREEEREMIPLCAEEGLAYMAWSPLARGRLAGPRADPRRLAGDPFAASRFDDRLDPSILDALDGLVTATGQGHALLSLAWLVARGAFPVTGATSIEQLDIAIAACATPLDPATIDALEAAYRPHPVAGFDPRDERPRG